MHNLVEPGAAVELLLRLAPDPSLLRMPIPGVNGAGFIWLIALPAIALGLLQFRHCQRPERVGGAAGSLNLIPIALLAPILLLITLAFFYLNVILEQGIAMFATVVFSMVTGAAFMHYGLRILVEWLETGADKLEEESWHRRESAGVLIAESLQTAWFVFLLSFLPPTGAALGVLMFALGQLIVARMNAIVPEGLVSDQGNRLFERLQGALPGQSALLVGVLYLLSLCLSEFEAAGIELLLSLLFMRLLLPIVSHLFTDGLLPVAVRELPADSRRELRWWCDAALAVFSVFLGGFVVLHVLRSPDFFVHADLWWMFSLAVATGLLARLVLDVLGAYYGRRLASSGMAPGPQSMLSINAIRCAEGVILVVCLLVADWLVWVDPLSRLAADLKAFNAWAFAAILLGYGYCLGDLVTGVPFGNRIETTPPGVTRPEISAPRYDVECLVLAVVGIVLLADAFDEPLVQFSIMNTKNAVGALLGVLLHGLLFPFAMAIPVDDAKNTASDRAVANVRRIHGFLALFFLHLGLGVALPMFSVFAFATCLLVMTLIDVFVGAGKSPDERFNQHTFLLIGYLGLGLGTELIRVFGTQGEMFLMEFPFIGHWLGDKLNINHFRYALSAVIVAFSVWLGFSLYRRGLGYRLTEAKKA